ncbi:hypothetical protein [Roseateles sp. P5_E1]
MDNFFFIDGHKVNNSQPRLSGMAIKQLGHQVDSSIDINHELVLESGHDPDRPIGDDEAVDLAHGHGQGPKRFSTRPRTNFGGF